jgi:hypothetical protein
MPDPWVPSQLHKKKKKKKKTPTENNSNVSEGMNR